jgi:hypothetical protein
MRAFLSALLALSVLSAIAAPLSAEAFDSKRFWDSQSSRY